jgi:hypothetical protein
MADKGFSWEWVQSGRQLPAVHHLNGHPHLYYKKAGVGIGGNFKFWIFELLKMFCESLMIIVLIWFCRLIIVAGGMQEGATQGGDAARQRGPRTCRHPASRLR